MPWKKSLLTKTPEAGYRLAIELAQESISQIQPNEKIREKLRPKYSRNASDLIAAANVVALHFQTVAQANDYWRSKSHNLRSSVRVNM